MQYHTETNVTIVEPFIILLQTLLLLVVRLDSYCGFTIVGFKLWFYGCCGCKKTVNFH